MKYLLVLFLLVPLARAHQPLWNPGSPTPEAAYGVVEEDISKAIFGRLREGEAAYFRFDLPDDFALELDLFASAACDEAFQPELWLLGEHLPESAVPFAALEGYGAREYEAQWRPYSGHGVVARQGPGLRELLAEGSYYVVVRATASYGYYLLSLAGREVLGGTLEGFASIRRFNVCRTFETWP